MAFILSIFMLATASQYVIPKNHAFVEVTAAEAATAADWFIARGAWDGDRTEILECILKKQPDGKFEALCDGTEIVLPDMLPKGAKVLEVVN